MAKGSSKGAQTSYANYKSQNRFTANRKRKLLKAQKSHPNNLQIAEALENIKYRRKIPGKSVWTKTKIAIAAMNTKYHKKEKLPKMHPSEEKKMFSLGVRARVEGVSNWKAS
jgi:hypothetical protein